MCETINEWWDRMILQLVVQQGLPPLPTDEEWDAIEPVPLSDERIKEIVEYATREDGDDVPDPTT